VTEGVVGRLGVSARYLSWEAVGEGRIGRRWEGGGARCVEFGEGCGGGGGSDAPVCELLMVEGVAGGELLDVPGAARVEVGPQGEPAVDVESP